MKNVPTLRNGGPGGTGIASPLQLIHVTCPARVLPATTTDIIFRVFGGRIIVHQLIGEVTTVCSATVTTVKASGKKLDNSAAAVGTAVDIASATAVTSQEVGSLLVVPGAGAALSVGNAGGSTAAVGPFRFVAPQGEIYITTSATNTGATKWDLWYQPLDEGAYVVGQATAAVAI